MNKLYETFKDSEGVPTRLRFENALVKYVINYVKVVEPEIRVSNGAVIKTLSPVLLPNPLTPLQRIRKFTVNPGVMLWIPMLIANGVYTPSEHDSTKALITLETCLTEHYATRQKTVFINYDNKREPSLKARAKYLITRTECREKRRSAICCKSIRHRS